MTRSKRRSSPFLSRCSGSLSVSPWRISALRMPCRSMFILQMAQVPPLSSCPANSRLRASPPVSCTYCFDWINKPPEPQVGS